jgi:hypothetical protein
MRRDAPCLRARNGQRHAYEAERLFAFALSDGATRLRGRVPRRPAPDDRRPTTDDRRPTTDDRRPTTARLP